MDKNLREKLGKELRYQTARSSGPGGQHVNRTETKVELHWNLTASKAIGTDRKELLKKRLSSRLTKDGELILYSEETRSQVKNKELVTARFMDLVERMLIPPKKRIPTRHTRSSKEKRLKAKKIRGERKQGRGPIKDY